MFELQERRIVLGITGGVAAYKAAELCRLLKTNGAQVQVVMTEAACRFIAPMTFQALSGQPVITSQWDGHEPNAMPHINATRAADAVVVAPATADFMAQLATGLAGEVLATMCLARSLATCPLFLAPAMNKEMWNHPATQRNLAQVQADGAFVLGPARGDQACGEIGQGRMLEAAEIFMELVYAFVPKLLKGRRVVITAGPTFEPLDSVRGLTNHSSGKMGFALAQAAAEAGADVTLIAGPVVLPTPLRVKRMDVQTAQQMYDTVLPCVQQADIFIATAAVADWRPEHAVQGKIKKTAHTAYNQISLLENPDILASVAALPDAPYCVGFAAESENIEQYAKEKRLRKKIPLIVANNGPEVFGKDESQLLLIDEAGCHELVLAGKLAQARLLVREIAHRLENEVRQ